MGKLLLILLLFPVTVLCQNSFLFNRIGKEDGLGLASNNVFCTYQDKQGFMWVGTSNGLQRFDGNRFIHFGKSRPQPTELPISTVHQIIPLTDHSLLLLLSSEQKVGVFDTRSFTFTNLPIRYRRQPDRTPQLRIHKDGHGNLFVFAWKYGVLHFDSTQKAFIEDNFFQLPPKWIPSVYIYEDRKTDLLWLPVFDYGLAAYDYRTKKLYTSSYNPKNLPLLNKKELGPGVAEFYIDSKRRHWVFRWGHDHYYHCYDEQGNALPDTAGLLVNPEYSELRFFFESKDNTVWFFGNNCLYSLGKNSNRMFFHPQTGSASSAITYRSVTQMMEDRDGIIWLCTDNGLYYLSSLTTKRGVTNMAVAPDGDALEITDLLELQGGELWVSSWGDGILTYDRNMQLYDAGVYRAMPVIDKIQRSQYRQVWGMLQDKKGKVWIACQAGNYMVYDTATKRTEFFNLKEAEFATLRYIAEDHKGQLWFGTQRGHLIRYDGKRFQTMQVFKSIVRKILIDDEGIIWAATEGNGVFSLNPDGSLKKHFDKTDSGNPLFSNYVYDLEQLDDSTIICAAGALNFINKRTGKVSWTSFENGLPGNTSFRIRRDRKGYLWINTLDGFCRYNPYNHTITLYGKKDGMEVEKHTIQADLLTRNGDIVFAGENYLLKFDPDMFEGSAVPPNVSLTDFRLFNQSLLLDSLLAKPQVILSHDQHSFTIDFSALSFLQRDKLVYYYRMKGAGEEWKRAERQFSATYTLLPPGDYQFEVYCANIDGTRSKEVTVLPIRVRPPFWQTWWFISAVALLTALTIYYLYRQRINKLLAVEAVRSRVARDLHDDVGSTLSTINILGSMAKTRLQVDTVKTSEYISKITENSQRMMEAMDDIVWSIKPDNDTMQKIIVRMKEFALSVLEAKEMSVRFIMDENVGAVRLNMEARRDFFLIFKEAINNTAKYSRARNVIIHLACHQRRLVLTIKDDGIGFDPQKADGNGLGNMEKRAQSLKGRLQLVTKEGEGTRITLNIPIA